MTDLPEGGVVVAACFVLDNITWCVSLGANSETDYCKGRSLGSAPKINTGGGSENSRTRQREKLDCSEVIIRPQGKRKVLWICADLRHQSLNSDQFSWRHVNNLLLLFSHSVVSKSL